MKLTVLQWEKVQDELGSLPENDTEADALFRKIEHRTWGKSYQANCAIALGAVEQRMVDDAISRRTEAGRFDPHKRD